MLTKSCCESDRLLRCVSICQIEINVYKSNIMSTLTICYYYSGTTDHLNRKIFDCLVTSAAGGNPSI